MKSGTRKEILKWQALWLFHFFLLWNTTYGQIRYTIPEELNKGSFVGNIAKDLGLDLAEISHRKLRIASEAGKQYFTVDLGKGDLVVSERIDREYLCGRSVSCLLPLEIIVETPLQLHRLDIEIQDINDNAPNFLSNEHILKIAESTVLGARFPLESAQDPDVGINALRTFLINLNVYFVLNIINHDDGRKVPELILEKALDREKQPIHELVLTAVDGGNPARSGTTQITVVVLDNNDNIPQFDKPVYKVTLSENAPRDAVVVKVRATDLDEGPNGDIVYSFGVHTPDIVRTLFNIRPQTGEITLQGQLDHEEDRFYTIDVIAKDKGIPILEGHCNVQVNILDVNDNPPEIIFTSLPSSVLENASIGTVIALISARDLDSGDNGKIHLQLPADYPFILKPSFSNHYALVTDALLDREVVLVYDIEIIATDSGSPPLSTKKKITVNILDVNDNPPRFSQSSYSVYMKENNVPGTLLCSVSASDPDLDTNSQLSYSILDTQVQDVSVSSYIYINSENGSIYTGHSFDYEQIKVFQIQVQVKDHGTPLLSSNVTVIVFILDQNDNAPAVIYPLAEMGSLPHQKMPMSAKAGYLVTKVTAVDADSGQNAWISYRLIQATDDTLFSVALHTGEIRTKRGVLEQDDASQRLVIEIKDNGEPVQSATVTVTISLENGVYEPILDYHDTSKTHGYNYITRYLIISLASISAISFLTVVILTVKSIRNSSGRYFRRAASNDGYKHANRNLQIQLNTDGPIKYVEVLGGDVQSQSQSYRSCFSPVSEPSDFTFLKPSSESSFKDAVSCVDNTGNNAFQQMYNLQLTAFDGGTPEKSGTTKVIIKILDVNDNIPRFNSPVYKVSLMENTPIGKLLVQLNASDLDDGQNGEIYYSFSKHTPETVHRLFSVNSETGEIRVNGLIDFEDASFYEIDVQARDKGSPALEGSCNIKVEVIDVNDNAPEVTITSLSSPVVENALPGTVIALISVRDRDSGQNGEVLMQIPESIPFKLQSSFQGHYSLITDGPLDRETVPEYNITVTATDSGSPPLSSSIILPVSISDVNDNAPVFSQPSYTVHIQENNAPGATICSVTAFDADVGKNSQLSYSVLDSTIQGTSVSSYVYINSENGNIYSMRSFDYEQIKVFQIHVQVKDAGIPSLSSNVTVHVFVLDLNDNGPAVVYPSFPKGSALQLTVPRSAEAGYLITKIVAVDPDSGHNAWLSYSIPQSKDTGLFRVATYTGEIRTVRKLQDLDEAIQNLVIVVKDNGVPPLSSSVLIDIAVEENGSETSSEFRDTSAKQNGMSAITLYLIIALASVSAISFLTFVILIVKCLRQSRGHSGCLGCCCSSKQSLRSREAFQRSQKSLHLQLNPDGPIKYVEVVGGSMESQNQYYRSCLSPVSDRSDLMFIQTCSPSTPMGNTNTIDMSLSSSNLINTACEQKPANTDWRFSQGQRPGPSGSQRPEEAGPWPNPPTEAEQLQALMAAANEVSAATATLDAGTMGLSTRYSPQFTLQHVPDYRQNVYIPGSTSTLTGSNSQAEGKNPQPSSGNKKKSGKKEKK
ncbi:Protocadherin gamma-C5 [Acipenser ruthenus]|uniref:Protocadherin gamma-C5 n=1 Tax=Acipenser ruthenus TaxID=7906 RepID=A0A662YV46_ACIRT|nr:Protocadherin gamma-C5 [Acipenser ruthenus]